MGVVSMSIRWVWYQYQYDTARIDQAQYATTIYVSFFLSCVINGRGANNFIMPHKRNPNAKRAAQSRLRKRKNRNRGKHCIFDKVRKPTNSSKKIRAAHIASKALFQQMSVEEKRKVSVRFTAMFILVSYQ